MLKRILQIKLYIWTKLVLWRRSPTIIAITGSVGKTTTKEAIGHALKQHYGPDRVAVSMGNYNTEIGVPLTILQENHPGRSLLGWMAVGFRVLKLLITGSGPDIYVIEFGADRPGDIEYLSRMVRPSIGVVTAVGELPVHVEYYDTPEEVTAEKGRLIESLSADGIAILAVDEDRVWSMRERTLATVIGVGEGDEASVRGSDVTFYPEHLFKDHEPLVSLKINTNTQSIPLRMHNALTKGHVSAGLIAIAVGQAIGIPLLEIIESLHDWVPPSGRMRPVNAVRNSVVLDDSYNASPLSMNIALETLGNFANARRIAVLGDMRELGRYSQEAHEQAGYYASRQADILVAVGRYAPSLAEGASRGGMKEESIFIEHDSHRAADLIFEMVLEGDVILVKGSRAVEMEYVVQTLSEEMIS